MSEPGSPSSVQSLFEQLQREQADKKLPPVEQWTPEREGEIEIRIARDGTWYHEGEPIRREAMVRLFSTILRRDGDDYFLVTPVEKLRIEVEDAPFIGVRLEHTGEGREQQLLVTTNVDDHVVIDAEHRLEVERRAGGEPAPYVRVRGGLWALLSRNVFYELAELAVQGRLDSGPRHGVWSRGTFFPLE